MFDDTIPTWWYEQDGQQAGPVTAAALQRLVTEGRVGPAHRVWRDGMSGWQELSAVPELAPMLPARAPPPPPAPPPLSAPPRFGTGPGAPSTFGTGPSAAPALGNAASAERMEEISVPGVILLSILTLGIYGLVKFYQTGKGYEALAGRESRFSRNFWLFVGLGVGGFFANAAAPFLGVPLGIASLVFQVLTLGEALTVRDEGMRRAGIRPTVTSEGTHKALFVVGILLSFIVVGLIVLLVQAVKWFSDWNAIREALGGRRPG